MAVRSIDRSNIAAYRLDSNVWSFDRSIDRYGFIDRSNQPAAEFWFFVPNTLFFEFFQKYFFKNLKNLKNIFQKFSLFLSFSDTPLTDAVTVRRRGNGRIKNQGKNTEMM